MKLKLIRLARDYAETLWIVKILQDSPFRGQGRESGALHDTAKHTITVAEKLASLKARCKKGMLIDGHGRQIYFFQLAGCWGNPPDNYQEILENQNTELIRLRKRYTVIEMTCNPSGIQIS
jgi:hypothetical protein